MHFIKSSLITAVSNGMQDRHCPPASKSIKAAWDTVQNGEPLKLALQRENALPKKTLAHEMAERQDSAAAEDGMLITLLRKAYQQHVIPRDTPASQLLTRFDVGIRRQIIEDLYLKVCTLLQGGVLAPSLLGAKKSRCLTKSSLNRLRTLSAKLIQQAQPGNGIPVMPDAAYMAELATGPGAKLRNLCDIRKLGGHRFVMNGPALYIIRTLPDSEDNPDEGIHALRYQIQGGSESLEITNPKGKTFRLQTEHHYKSRNRRPVFVELNHCLLREIEQRQKSSG